MGTYPDPTIKAGAIGPSKLGVVPQARATKDAIQSVSHNTLTTVTFPTEQFDTADLHDVTTNTNRLTAPLAGVYLITASVYFVGGNAGVREIILRNNGSQFQREHAAGVTTALDTSPSISSLYRLAAGDFIDMQVFQDSGGSLNIGSSGTHLAMTWMGAG